MSEHGEAVIAMPPSKLDRCTAFLRMHSADLCLDGIHISLSRFGGRKCHTARGHNLYYGHTQLRFDPTACPHCRAEKKLPQQEQAVDQLKGTRLTIKPDKL